MSRHFFDTFHEGFPITVLLGWDRPASYFFLVIEKPTELGENTMTFDFLYSNLQEIYPFIHDLNYYREVLRHFNIDVPESMFIEVQHDCVRNVGNRIVTHQADGSFTERVF
ncbi:hypothetical protein [Halopseudomonas pelagia]|uniref:hypothetical protein n=1 Tax=Halopseudomonas pelagia TaxID=553151 RepID=UPI00039E8E51|nr:hypothetical protein [Halopseudomonas pelagia]